MAINAYPDPNGGTVNEWHVAACSDRYFVGMPYASSEMVVYDTNYRLIESVAEPI